MAQGNKIKTKGNPPKTAKQKTKDKGKAFNRRKNAPIQQKKAKFQEAQKLKQCVSKAVNQNIEDEMRKRAYDGSKSSGLSKAQEVVAKHNQKAATSAENDVSMD